MATAGEIRAALRRVLYLGLGASTVDLGLVRDIKVAGEQVGLTLAHTTIACPLRNHMIDARVDNSRSGRHAKR